MRRAIEEIIRDRTFDVFECMSTDFRDLENSVHNLVQKFSAAQKSFDSPNWKHTGMDLIQLSEDVKERTRARNGDMARALIDILVDDNVDSFKRLTVLGLLGGVEGLAKIDGALADRWRNAMRDVVSDMNLIEIKGDHHV